MTNEMYHFIWRDLVSMLTESSCVRGAMLYGSVARGDNDEYSDVDLLLITNDDFQDFEFIKNLVLKNWPTSFKLPISPAIYTKSNLSDMAHRGSLFACHLKKDGKMLMEKEPIFNVLTIKHNSYKDLNRDLSSYIVICEDSKEAIPWIITKTEARFEIAILAGITRNACISALAYLGEPHFSRLKAFELLNARVGPLPLGADEYLSLCRLRKIYDLSLSDEIDFNLVAYQAKVMTLLLFLREKLYVSS